MALRVFTDRDGVEWNVWHVRPTISEGSPLHARYREGWVCFQRADGAERYRMPIDQVPPGWEVMPDERLDLLRRVAAQPAEDGALADTGQEVRHSRVEDATRDSVSGPREIAGGSELRSET